MCVTSDIDINVLRGSDNVWATTRLAFFSSHCMFHKGVPHHPPPGGFSGFQVMEMIEGFFGFEILGVFWAENFGKFIWGVAFNLVPRFSLLRDG